jgi:hypothetical protein
MIRSFHRVLCLAAVCGAVLLPGAAHAQFGFPSLITQSGDGPDIDRAGLYLGLGAFGDVIINQVNSGTEFLTSGGGGCLFLGLRLHQNFALEFGVGQGEHNNVTDAWGNDVDYLSLNQVTADAKLILPILGAPWRPYLQGGLGFYMLTDAWSSELASGGGFQLGGGIDFWFNSWWSAGGRVLYRGIKFSSFTYQTGHSESPYLSTLAIEANIQLHF